MQRPLPEWMRHLAAAATAAAAYGRDDWSWWRHKSCRLLLFPHHGRVEATVENARNVRRVICAVHRVTVLLNKGARVLVIKLIGHS